MKKKNRKSKRLVILGQPQHRLFPYGIANTYRASRNPIVRVMGKRELTTSKILAFRKAFKDKVLRKFLVLRCNPFHEVTKKPQEVRMGKGHGTKIQKVTFPLKSGQIIAEVNVARRSRRAMRAKALLKKAATKFGFATRVTSMDI